MNEFDLIHKYFQSAPDSHAQHPRAVRLGIGDDCAVVSASQEDTVVSTDTLVEGRHFPTGCQADVVAARALGSSASDLAAMGANPLGFTLALSVPKIDKEWMTEFSQCLFECADKWCIPLIGGDTVCGPLVITVTVLGRVGKGEALLRQGAKTGDDLWVSGYLGDAAGGLSFIQNQCLDDAPSSVTEYLLRKYQQPEPRLLLGRSLVGLASAAIDISDGLLADLGHILKASDKGARLDIEDLPLSQQLIDGMGRGQAIKAALSGGDDYEICFTAPVSQRQRLSALSESSQVDCHLSRIGTIAAEPGLKVFQQDQLMQFDRQGFDHFQSANSDYNAS